MKNWPHKVHATGWYMVDWSANLAPGEVKPLRHFDTDLVLWRPEAGGDAQVMDAICPHLGANIGYGGKVCGEDVVCPFHGWQWSRQGVNTLIPPKGEGNPRVRMKAWHTREIDGIILVWHDVRDAEPTWEWPGVPAFRDTEGFYPIYPYGAHCYGERAIQPQSILENIADVEHFPYVHGAGGPGIHVEIEADSEHHLYARFALRYGAHGKPTWLTPNGPVDGEIEAQAWGLGLGMATARLEDKVFPQFIAITPIDLNRAVMWSTITGKRVPGEPEPAGVTAKMFKAQHAQLLQDIGIWEQQHWLEKPVYADNEAPPFVKVRHWAKKFYPEPATSSDGSTTRNPALASA